MTETPVCGSVSESGTLCSQSCLVVHWITSVSSLFVSVDACETVVECSLLTSVIILVSLWDSDAAVAGGSGRGACGHEHAFVRHFQDGGGGWWAAVEPVC